MKKSMHEEIAKVAYELYVKEGGIPGNDLKYWLEAENIVMKKHEQHAREMETRVAHMNKPPQGYRRTVKKEGFHTKI